MGKQVPTGSTKRNRKGARDDWGAASSSAERPRKAKPSAAPESPAPSDEFPERWWPYACGAILLLAFALRVYALEMKPLHHDEGVNGFFLTNLLRQGRYAYDPANYHGPTLYYITLPFVALFGLHTFVIRLVPSLFGVGVVWLVLALRRYVGTVAALVAALLVAVSPACVFYSRYFIHETPFVFFTLALVVASLRFRETGAAADLLYAAAAAALMFATKETAFISAGVLLIAFALSEWWVRAVARTKWAQPPEPKRKKGKEKRTLRPTLSYAPLRLVETLGGWTHVLYLLVAALAVFLFVNVIYYSSFFTNPKGVADSVEAFKIWRKTGESGFHGYPFYKFFEWLVFGHYGDGYDFGEEPMLALLATEGALLALWKTRRRFPLFAALWGFGLFAAYSIIEYKTPWLALSWLLPWAVAGGYAIDKLYRMRRWRVVSLALLGVCLAVAAYQSYQLNFVHYDDDRYPYVYAHTRREFHDLLARMDEIARAEAASRTGDKYEAGINVAVENQEYWPLPWYVRDYKHIGYTGHVGETNDAMILVKTSQVPQVESMLGSRYVRVGGTYPLRPGVDLALFARRDLAAGR